MTAPLLGRAAQRLANASAVRAMKSHNQHARGGGHGSRRQQSSKQSKDSASVHWSVWAVGAAVLLIGGYSLSSTETHLGSPDVPIASKAPQVLGPQPKVWTVDEIAKHKKRGQGVFLAIDGKVFDVDGYLDEHPIGAKPLLHHAGEDISKVFHKLHKPGTLERMLERGHVTEMGVVDPTAPPPEPAPWVPPKK